MVSTMVSKWCLAFPGRSQAPRLASDSRLSPRSVRGALRFVPAADPGHPFLYDKVARLYHEMTLVCNGAQRQVSNKEVSKEVLNPYLL